MGVAEDLNAEVAKILKEVWTSRDGKQIPDVPDLKLGNDAVKVVGTVLYADLADSTGLVAAYEASFAAEVYKIYLTCACRIIRNNGGEITAFDGDRVMAVFLGDAKNTNAMKTSLQINYAVLHVINPRLKDQYPSRNYAVRQSVGIDTSELFIARTGIRGANDLVWVGNAANRAAKLCALRRDDYSSWVTAAVYDAAHPSSKHGGLNNAEAMWEFRTWTDQGAAVVYCSRWWWKP